MFGEFRIPLALHSFSGGKFLKLVRGVKPVVVKAFKAMRMQMI